MIITPGQRCIKERIPCRYIIEKKKKKKKNEKSKTNHDNKHPFHRSIFQSFEHCCSNKKGHKNDDMPETSHDDDKTKKHNECISRSVHHIQEVETPLSQKQLSGNHSFFLHLIITQEKFCAGDFFPRNFVFDNQKSLTSIIR